MNVSVLFASLMLAVFGPTANPETQYRMFWGMQFNVAKRCLDAGFNLLSSAKNPDETNEFAKWLPFCRENGIDFMPMLLKFRKNDDPKGQSLLTMFPRVGSDGLPVKGAGIDAALAADFFRSKADRWAKEYARRYGHSRELVGFMTSSEVRDDACPSFTPALTSAWLRAGGELPVPEKLRNRWGVNWRTQPDFPADGIVPDDDPIVLFYRWYWLSGDGWNDFQSSVAASFNRAFDRPVLTFYDPDMRVPPLYGSGGRVTHTGMWIYPYQEPALADYIVSEQQAMARGNPGCGLMTGIQGISYRSKLAPSQQAVENPPEWLTTDPDAVYITTPPDLLREGFWFLFARKLDGLYTHGQNSVFGPKGYKGGYRFTNDQLEGTYAELFHSVAEPLGPLLKALPERPAEVAVLESFTSVVYGGRHAYGWGSDEGTMLTLAGLSPQVLYDEEVIACGIPPSLRVLFVHDCEALTRSVYLRVKEFQERGGIVVGSERTLPAVTPDLELPRFLRTNKLSEDHVGIRRAAAEIRQSLSSRYVPFAESDNDGIIVHTRSFGSTDYVFAINDRRTAGAYVGQWSRVYEKGLPNSGKVIVNRTAGAVYDLVAHRQVPFSVSNGKTAVEVSYDTNDGRLLAFLDKPLSPLSAECVGGRLRVTSSDRHVMIPVELSADGVRPYYGVVADGEFCPLAFEPDGVATVRIRNLMDDSVLTCGILPEKTKTMDLISRRAKFRQALSNPSLREEAIRRGLSSDDAVFRRAAKYARDGGRKVRRFPFYRKNVALSQDASNDHSVTLVSKIDLPTMGWRFLKDPENVLFDGEAALFKDPDGWRNARQIAIGRPWEEQSVVGYDGYGWYRLTFPLPERPASCDSLELCFDGVDEEAWVWLNGTYVGQHAEGEDGYAQPFRFGVLDEVRWGGENTIVVRVNDTKGAGGIWKGVRFEIMRNSK